MNLSSNAKAAWNKAQEYAAFATEHLFHVHYATAVRNFIEQEQDRPAETQIDGPATRLKTRFIFPFVQEQVFEEMMALLRRRALLRANIEAGGSLRAAHEVEFLEAGIVQSTQRLRDASKTMTEVQSEILEKVFIDADGNAEA